LPGSSRIFNGGDQSVRSTGLSNGFDIVRCGLKCDIASAYDSDEGVLVLSIVCETEPSSYTRERYWTVYAVRLVILSWVDLAETLKADYDRTQDKL
jgi:hypothetical protein